MDRQNCAGSGIGARRRELGLSQEDLAGRAQRFGWDVDSKLVSKIEAGHRRLTDGELYWLATLLECTTDSFYPSAKEMKNSFLKTNPAKAALKPSIISLLGAAGVGGLTVLEISEKLKVQGNKLHAWFNSTGKNIDGLKKVGRGRWSYKDPSVGG